MGTHPIFESDFDSLTECDSRLSVDWLSLPLLDPGSKEVPSPTRQSKVWPQLSVCQTSWTLTRNGILLTLSFPVGSDASTSPGGSGFQPSALCSLRLSGCTSVTTPSSVKTPPSSPTTNKKSEFLHFCSTYPVY